jgi:amino acid permease
MAILHPLSKMGAAKLLVLWAVLICCVVVGSLLPAASPVMEAGQHFSPGRDCDWHDLLRTLAVSSPA